MIFLICAKRYKIMHFEKNDQTDDQRMIFLSFGLNGYRPMPDGAGGHSHAIFREGRDGKAAG